jgi:regulator of protease activity HflC (stomatin/prohibitin superfamily)
MITGDGNLLEVQGSVRYSIADARVYAFEVAEPETVIRAAAESVLREVVASSEMGALLTSGRESFGATVQRRLTQRLIEIHPGGVGVRIEGVSLHDLHPPQEVVQSYHEVTRAMELRDRRINEAEADRIARKREQQARGQEVIRRAEAARFEKIRLAEARRSEFLARYRARSELSWADWWKLAGEMHARLEAGVPVEKVKEEYRQRRAEILSRQEALTDFRLYWDSLTLALSGRPKVLIDSDKVPTRRSLWLVPFEPPAVPAPALRPRTKTRPAEEDEP